MSKADAQNEIKKPEISNEWKPNPWYKRSEEFYGMVYKGGSCRYCGKLITTPLDVCDCAGMKTARGKFKKLINQQAGIMPKQEPTQADEEEQDYNPDAFTEPGAGVV